MPGTLYLVSTPIGNPEDITYRAVRVLGSVQLVAAEDSALARALLDRYTINTPITSYPGPDLKEKVGVLLNRLLEGHDIALICDGGTPVLWDPGARLVQAAGRAGVSIVPVPGPSAAIAPLPVSAFNAETFWLHGPMPRTAVGTRRLFERLRQERATVVIFITAATLVPALRRIQRILGNRKVLVAKDVTKPSERFVRGQVDAVLRVLSRQRMTGKFTMVIEGNKRAAVSLERKRKGKG